MICFGILVHENMEVVKNQIENILIYNPGSLVVLYNGSSDEHFTDELQRLTNSESIFICPYSRPMQWGKLGRVLLDLMTWIHKSNFNYDYLVYLDSDNMCIRAGFESFLDEQMKGYDVMGVDMWVEDDRENPKNLPSKLLWREWKKWKRLFKTDYFIRVFNPLQTFRYDTVELILDRLNRPFIEMGIATTHTFALEEYLYVTIAVLKGAKYRSYPKSSSQFIRDGEPLSLKEVQKAAQISDVFFIHKIKIEMNDPARAWITSRSKR